jgi:hypothetical protein
MYLGALVGLVFQVVFSQRRSSGPPWKLIPFFGALVLGFGFDGINSFLHLIEVELFGYEPANWLRLITGTGMGLVIAVVVFPLFNQTVWADIDPAPAVPGWKGFASLLLLGALVVLLVLTENPLILYPLALASAGTVLLLLTMVYTIVWILLLRKENSFSHINQLSVPLTLGFITALTQIAIFNFGRFWLTGTWDGFVIG